MILNSALFSGDAGCSRTEKIIKLLRQHVDSERLLDMLTKADHELSPIDTNWFDKVPESLIMGGSSEPDVVQVVTQADTALFSCKALHYFAPHLMAMVTADGSYT
jgi:hypothetical protein